MLCAGQGASQCRAGSTFAKAPGQGARRLLATAVGHGSRQQSLAVCGEDIELGDELFRGLPQHQGCGAAKHAEQVYMKRSVSKEVYYYYFACFLSSLYVCMVDCFYDYSIV